MAYETNIVLSMDELYDALITFMTANGWSLYDNIPITGSRDRVMFSPGANGKFNMYYRISTNQFGNPYKDPADVHVKIPQIFIRGYHSWNAVTHSGSGEHGDFGGVIFAGQQYSNSQDYFMYPFEKPDGTLAQPLNPTGYLVQTAASDGGMAGWTTSYNGQCLQYTMIASTFDGYRRVWNASGDGVTFMDIITGEKRNFTSGGGSLSWQNQYGIQTKDPITDKEVWYNLAWNSQTFMRWIPDTNTWGYLMPPPGVITGGNMVWDGNDFIYAHPHNSTTNFYRYSISANSWTTLATAPAFTSRAQSSGQTGDVAVYAPASLTGFSEDVIYYIAEAGTLIYRYDVTSNAWRSTVPTGALTSPVTLTATVHLFWDHKRYMYLWAPQSNVIYRSDLSTSPNTFTSLGTLDNANRQQDAGLILTHMVSKIRCSNVIPVKYFFHGDADSIRIVTRVSTSSGNGRYYWTYMGKFDTAYRTQTMGMTAAVTPGVRITVNVDSVSGYSPGDVVTVANWAGSHFEKTTIYTTGSNYIVCNLTSSFPSGSKIGVDPSQTIVTGDCGRGVAAINCNGFRTDYEPDWYYVWPESDYVSSARCTPTSRNLYVPARFKIFNGEQFSVTAQTTMGSRTGNSKYECLGYLKGIYALQQGNFPQPQNEDVLSIGDRQYIYFSLQTNMLSATDKRGIVIGPIS